MLKLANIKFYNHYQDKLIVYLNRIVVYVNVLKTIKRQFNSTGIK